MRIVAITLFVLNALIVALSIYANLTFFYYFPECSPEIYCIITVFLPVFVAEVHRPWLLPTWVAILTILYGFSFWTYIKGSYGKAIILNFLALSTFVVKFLYDLYVNTYIDYF